MRWGHGIKPGMLFAYVRLCSPMFAYFLAFLYVRGKLPFIIIKSVVSFIFSPVFACYNRSCDIIFGTHFAITGSNLLHPRTWPAFCKSIMQPVKDCDTCIEEEKDFDFSCLLEKKTLPRCLKL